MTSHTRYPPYSELTNRYGDARFIWSFPNLPQKRKTYFWAHQRHFWVPYKCHFKSTTEVRNTPLENYNSYLNGKSCNSSITIKILLKQGLVTVPFLVYWTSPYSSHLVDHIPNGWVMWNMGTFNDPCKMVPLPSSIFHSKPTQSLGIPSAAQVASTPRGGATGGACFFGDWSDLSTRYFVHEPMGTVWYSDVQTSTV